MCLLSFGNAWLVFGVMVMGVMGQGLESRSSTSLPTERGTAPHLGRDVRQFGCDELINIRQQDAPATVT